MTSNALRLVVRESGTEPGELPRCQRCNSPTSLSERHCSSCGVDLGPPNVRAADSADEVRALGDRFATARGEATARAAGLEFASFTAAVQSRSRVVVAMSALAMRTLLADTRSLYATHAGLVQGQARRPAEFHNATRRAATEALLFGGYADEIRYGVLALGAGGLHSYGPLFATLKDVSVDSRTSFLEENSFTFVEAHALASSSAIPFGYRSGWSRRGELAATKLGARIQAGDQEPAWPTLVLEAGSTRADDSFIEAHIYGPFDANAIDSIAFRSADLTRAEKNDISIVRELAVGRFEIVELS